MGLSADPTPEDMSAGRRAARTFIVGNRSNTHGGGIMCNGVLQIGVPNTTTTALSSVAVHADKALLDINGIDMFETGKYADGSDADMSDEKFQFRFVLVPEFDCSLRDGRPVPRSSANLQEAVNEPDGKILFTIDGLADEGDFRYYLYEEPGDRTDVRYDGTVYRLTVHVTATGSVRWDVDGGTKVNVTTYGGQVTKTEKLSADGSTWTEAGIREQDERRALRGPSQYRRRRHRPLDPDRLRRAPARKHSSVCCKAQRELSIKAHEKAPSLVFQRDGALFRHMSVTCRCVFLSGTGPRLPWPGRPPQAGSRGPSRRRRCRAAGRISRTASTGHRARRGTRRRRA